MSTSHRDTLTARALADLDAAPHAPLTAAQQQRAHDTLDRILAAESATESPTAFKPVSPFAPRALLVVAAAAALALVVSVTGVLGGGTAYASWTARPTLLPPSEQEELGQRCREQLAQGADGRNDAPSAEQLIATDLVVADTRGDWSYVVLSGAGGLEANCLVERHRLDPLGWSGGMVGSYGFIAPPAPPPDRIAVGTSLMATGSGEGSFWATDGYVGAEVLAVDIVTASGTSIAATVIADRFAAWWPDRIDLDSSPENDPFEEVRYVVTLIDGTVLPAMTYTEISVQPRA